MEYQVITPEGVEYLKSVTAPDRVFYGDEIEYDYAHDEMPDFGIHAPDVLVEVLSTEEVSKVMRYAYEHCIPAVSYTHLDVYKRQYRRCMQWRRCVFAEHTESRRPADHAEFRRPHP